MQISLEAIEIVKVDLMLAAEDRTAAPRRWDSKKGRLRRRLGR